MNRSFKYTVQLLVVAGLVFITSACGNNFLNTKPEDSASLVNYYVTNGQVKNSTNILYGAPWYYYNTKFSWAASALQSGNGRSWSGDIAAFGNFSLIKRGNGGSTNKVLAHGWQSLWTVIAQANQIITNLNNHVGSNVDHDVIEHALGEAHVMRALAYFKLVQLWGPVPLIKKNIKHVSDVKVPRIKVEDIYKFIINDLEYGVKHCKDMAQGLYLGAHITSGSAKGLLAKVYLTYGTLGNSGAYDKAYNISKEVIQSGEFQLLDNYAALFKTENDNNIETMIALQWSDAGYGKGNGQPAFFSMNSTLTGVGTGWASLSPTINLQNAFKSETHHDDRRKATLMLAGDHYPQLLQSKGGFTVPKDVNAQGTAAAVKKYVIGTPADNGGKGSPQARANNTYMLRYADVLLVNAEAAIRGGHSTDAKAPMDKVRNRAGLPDLNHTPTIDDLLKERRLEFAFESMYWFTLKRVYNANPGKAKSIISSQERGTYAKVPFQKHPPTIYSVKIDPPEIQWLLPYPEVDVTKNPYFDKPPQSYDFSKNK